MLMLISCRTSHITKTEDKLTRKEKERVKSAFLYDTLNKIIINPPYLSENTSTQIKPNYKTITTYYATDRNLVFNNGRPNYGTERSKVSYGSCQVSLPINHELGKVESPAYHRFEFKENPSFHIVVLNIMSKEKSVFFNDMSNKNDNKENSAIIYVHGYNTSFSESAQRTAQLSYDLGFEGTPIFYSWPSQEVMYKYSIDEDNSEWSTANFRDFLVELLTKSKFQNIYLLAHSMGNRVVTNAIRDISNDKNVKLEKLKELFLVAPDIDSDLFKQSIVPSILQTKIPVTLYTSSKDKALFVSKVFNGNRRVGDSSKSIFVMPGIETVDVSNVDESIVGHTYFANNRPVVTDIQLIIKNKLRATKRNLLNRSYNKNVYWEFRP